MPKKDFDDAHLPLMELFPWQARYGGIKRFSVLEAGQHRTVTARIPAKIKHNARLRLPGVGLSPDPDSPPSDMIVRVYVNTWQTVTHVLVGLLVLLGFITGTALLALGLAGIWATIVYCQRYRRRHSGTPRTGRLWARFRYHLCATAVLYLIPMGLALTFYLLLSAYLTGFSEVISVGRLLAMQHLFERVSGFVADNLKLSEFKVLVILVAIYLLSCLLLGSNSETDSPRFGIRFVRLLHRLAGGYAKYSGPITAGLATLAAFTFFGTQLGQAGNELKLRIKTTQDTYAGVAKQVETELSERVAAGLYDKIRDQLPQSYRDALRQPDELSGVIAVVAPSAGYHMSDPAVERLVQAEVSRTAQATRLASDHHVIENDRRDAPKTATQKQTRTAAASLPKQTSPGVQLIGEGEKKIVLHLEKLITEQLVKLIEPVVKAHPILEPLVSAWVEAMDETVQERIGQAYDRALKTAMDDPMRASAVMNEEATSVASQTDVTAAARRAVPKANSAIEARRQTLAAVKASDDWRAYELTGRLSAPDRNVRDKAAIDLIDMGSRVSSQRISELVRIMGRRTSGQHTSWGTLTLRM